MDKMELMLKSDLIFKFPLIFASAFTPVDIFLLCLSLCFLKSPVINAQTIYGIEKISS